MLSNYVATIAKTQISKQELTKRCDNSLKSILYRLVVENDDFVLLYEKCTENQDIISPIKEFSFGNRNVDSNLINFNHQELAALNYTINDANNMYTDTIISIIIDKNITKIKLIKIIDNIHLIYRNTINIFDIEFYNNDTNNIKHFLSYCFNDYENDESICSNITLLSTMAIFLITTVYICIN